MLAASLAGGICRVAEEVRPRAPLFFLSYAHAGGRQQITKFFNDLTENVGQLVGRPVGADPGFMDRRMPDGSRWSSELLGAVGGCQVFVAMLSSPYITSAWSGMEWFAFTQRTVSPVADTSSEYQTAIVPVIWAPISRRRAPQVVQDVQWFMPSGLADLGIPDLYEANGVYGLMAMGLQTFYQAVVWELAKHISEVSYSYLVEPLVLRKEQLHDAFREDG
jgi:hypothetical protein